MGILSMATMLQRRPGGCTAHIERNAIDSWADGLALVTSGFAYKERTE
jgi:hypothetical protein